MDRFGGTVNRVIKPLGFCYATGKTRTKASILKIVNDPESVRKFLKNYNGPREKLVDALARRYDFFRFSQPLIEEKLVQSLPQKEREVWLKAKEEGWKANFSLKELPTPDDPLADGFCDRENKIIYLRR
ncbi:MAG: hypothetical protein ABIB65_04815, partial [Candidatus Margulisiibacteriota bacterium]